MLSKEISRIIKSMGINEEDFNKKVQNKYTEYLKKDALHRVKYIQQLTGIKPKFSEDVVQEIYIAYAKAGQVNELESAQDIIGIKPSDDVYRALVEHLMKELKG